jgi:O-antigen/teichoic acid export membrane protein
MQRTKKVARNIGVTLITQLFSFAMTFVVLLFLPRYLGADGMGKMTLAFSYSAIFGLVLGFISGTVLVREIARDRDRLAEMVSTAFVLRIPLAIVMCFAGAWVARLLSGVMGYTPELQRLFLITLLWGVLISSNDVLSCALRGLEEIPRQNVAAIAEKIIYCLLILFLVWRREPLPYILGAGLVSQAVSMCILANGVSPYFKAFVPPTRAASESLIRASLPFVTTYLFITIYGQCDPQLLKKMSHLADIGWYGLAKRLAGSTMFVPVAISSAMLPTLSRLFHEDVELYDRVVRRFVGYMFLLVVPFAAVLIFAPVPLLSILHMGASFNGAIPVLIILGFSIILWFLSQAAATALIARDGQDVLSRATGVAALMAVPVTAVLIWVTQRLLANGAVGAILADTAVEVYLVTAYIRALPKGCVTSREFGVLIKASIAAIPMVVPLYFVHGSEWSLLVTIPGAILFFPICYLLGCLQAEDIDVVKTALGGKFASNPSLDLAIERGATVTQDIDLARSVSMEAQEQVAAVEETHNWPLSQLGLEPTSSAEADLGNAA